MRLIDADALIEKLGIAKECNDCKHNEEPYCRWKPDVVDICEAINDAPTIDERKTGEWTKENACEFCGFQPWYERDIHTLSFCQNCGADMRGK